MISKMADTTVVIGIDVGGTNTDAVVLGKAKGEAKVLAGAKTLTTADITSGVKEAIRLALLKLEGKYEKLAVQQVNIGTTHFINAVVEGKRLAKVSVIRLCGTASKRLPPFIDFPANLAQKIEGSVFLTSGGFQFDGQEIAQVNEEEILTILDTLKKKGERHIVVSGIFSPLRPDQENQVVELIQKHYPEASSTASKSIGRIGLLERENAAILNECIRPLCSDAINGFRESLKDLGLHCPMYLTQNDGTILSEEMALQFPVHTFASGPTNSMRGAAFLSGIQEALVVDIGGTSTDVGVLMKGFPRHASAEVKIAGVKTNFRMPDVISIGLGGGSYVKEKNNNVKVGPQSAGYNILQEAFVFANDGDVKERAITATDIAVTSGIADVGNKANLESIGKEFADKGIDVIHEMITECIDQMRFNDRDLPMILVGGGSILVDTKRKFDGVSSVLKPEYFDVANAVGAALSQVSASLDNTIDLDKLINKSEFDTEVKHEQESIVERSDKTDASAFDKVRQKYLKDARDRALNESIGQAEKAVIEAGGMKDSIQLLDKEDIPISYIPGSATRIKVKVVAELKPETGSKSYIDIESLKNKTAEDTGVKEKQTVTSTGKSLDEDNLVEHIQTVPNVDAVTGEWILNEYDIECISIGAGIQGTGGGGNPNVGRLSALKALREGKKIRVITPTKFFSSGDRKNDLTIVVAFMGAPVAFYEKLISGNETVGALECMEDIYNIGKYKDSDLQNKEGVTIPEEEDGLILVQDYKPSASTIKSAIEGRKVTALMSAEIGGMNCLEPLIVAADLNLPVLDCDGMGRAFPELQMFAPFIYGCKIYPSTIADDKGRRAVALKAKGPKQLEDAFRRVAIDMGCTSGIVLSHFNQEEIMKYTIQHSLSFARRIGHTILQARHENKSAVDEMIKCTNGKLLINGKLTDIKREITAGFSKGLVKIDGLDSYAGKKVVIDFQNEFLIVRLEGTNEILACVPDLITILDIDTALPIPTEEVHYGMRVSVIAMPVAPLMATDTALKWVGPQAFGYGEDVQYSPVTSYPQHPPVGPIH